MIKAIGSSDLGILENDKTTKDILNVDVISRWNGRVFTEIALENSTNP